MVRFTERVRHRDVAYVRWRVAALLLPDAANIVAPPELRLAGVHLDQHLLDLRASLPSKDPGLLLVHVLNPSILERLHVPFLARKTLAPAEPLAVDGLA